MFYKTRAQSFTKQDLIKNLLVFPRSFSSSPETLFKNEC